jgi:glutamate transport system permease protein
VVALKDTTLGIIIGSQDVINTGRQIYTDFRYNNAIIVGLMLALVFIIINYSLSKLAVYVERRLARRGAGTDEPLAAPALGVGASG